MLVKNILPPLERAYWVSVYRRNLILISGEVPLKHEDDMCTSYGFVDERLIGVYVDTQFARRPPVITHISADTSYIRVSEIVQLHSYIVICSLCFSVIRVFNIH